MGDAPEEFSRQNASSGSSYFRNKHILFTSRLQKIPHQHFEFYILRASHMKKSSKNEKSLWIKSRKKPGPKKKGKIGFSEDRKRDLAEINKGSWFDQEILVDVEGSVEGDHEELEQRPSNLSTVIGSSTQRSIAVRKSCRVTLQASCENIKYRILHPLGRFLSSAAR